MMRIFITAAQTYTFLKDLKYILFLIETNNLQNQTLGIRKLFLYSFSEQLTLSTLILQLYSSEWLTLFEIENWQVRLTEKNIPTIIKFGQTA